VSRLAVSPSPRCVFLLVLCISAARSAHAAAPPEIEARRNVRAPVIDGVLEEAWHDAASVTEFIQRQPGHGSPASESTAVWVMYDDEHLYVAFRCAVRDIATVHARLTETADAVQVFLDTFDDDATCYGFSVRASGTEYDYRMTDNGRWTEEWDGVWRSGVKRYDWGWSAEIAIPFKALRYDVKRDRWGIDFSRTTIASNERTFWSSYEKTGFRVSQMGSLVGIRPPRPGLHLEVYPVGLARVEEGSLWPMPAAGLDLSWLPAPAVNLQLTTFPDFAEIEADPYRVNLTRYEFWLDERRPFFVEAQETFGTGYQPIRLFYSRRIGRALSDNTVVPILGGAKLTGRFGTYTTGGLVSVTRRTEYDRYGTPGVEPASLFSVFSLRRSVLAGSEVGLVYAGKDNESSHNHAAGLDAVLRFEPFTAKLFGAASRHGDSLGSGLALRADHRTQHYATYLNARRIDPLFNANGAGYTGWRGQEVYLSTGPQLYNSGPFQQGNVQFNGGLERVWDEPGWTWTSGFSGYGQLHDRSYFTGWADLGRKWEEDTLYTNWSAGLHASTDYSRPVQVYASGSWTSLAYNYRRAVFAPNASATAGLSGRAGDHFALGIEAEAILEFRPGHELQPREDVTLILSPECGVHFTPKMQLILRGEAAFGYDPHGHQRYRSYRGGALYQWTFRPRSTLHLAYDQAADNSPGELALASRTSVVKLRYLFVF